jgi:hypothetical protein
VVYATRGGFNGGCVSSMDNPVGCTDRALPPINHLRGKRIPLLLAKVSAEDDPL